MADPLSVPCEDCLAPTNSPCLSNVFGDGQTHETRRRLADLRALTHGACALCGRFMVYGPVLDTPPDAWHPDPADAAACPPLPDPTTDWNAYATAINLGLSPGHPGVEHFRAPANPRWQSSCVSDPDHRGFLTDGTGMLLCAVCDGGCETDYGVLLEQGRALASQREDVIAAGVDPADLTVPIAPLSLTGAMTPVPAVCPECTAGKHPNCTLITLDPVLDDYTPCTCTHQETT